GRPADPGAQPEGGFVASRGGFELPSRSARSPSGSGRSRVNLNGALPWQAPAPGSRRGARLTVIAWAAGPVRRASGRATLGGAPSRSRLVALPLAQLSSRTLIGMVVASGVGAWAVGSSHHEAGPRRDSTSPAGGGADPT